MSVPTIEERLTAVEAELQQIKREKEQTQQNTAQDKETGEPRGWKRLVGIFADNPEFEEAVKAGKEWRDSFGPPDYEETS